MTDFTLRPLTVPERKYTYAQSSQLQGQTGNIGYCKMLPLIVTTNLGLNEMKSTDLDTAHQRIYSRILEMCVPIYCGGEDKRKEEGTEKLVQVQNLITG